MSRNEKDELPPAYTDVPDFSRSNTHRGQQILDQLTLTRTHHIRSVINTHIIPLVEKRASYGIAKTTIAILPSDIPLPAAREKSEFSFDTDTSKDVEILGFVSEEEPEIIRLEGQMNRGGVLEGAGGDHRAREGAERVFERKFADEKSD